MDKVTSVFLSQASQHLFAASPSTSAHLSFQNIEYRRPKESRAESNVCKGCGTLSIPGSTSRRYPVKSRNRKTPASASSFNASWTAHCMRCGRDTLQHSSSKKAPNARPRRHAVEPIAKPLLREPTSTDRADDRPSSGNEPKLNSKKRAKARNDRSSLQALLSKNSATPSTARLSFVDFMKK